MVLYRLLLLLFPRAFRARFGTDMTELFDARLSQARATGWGSLCRLWSRTIADVTTHGMAERRRSKLTNGDGSRGGQMLQDLKSAWRAVWRRPGFSLGVMTMLGLGLGFNVALFAVVESALLRPLPYPDADRLAFVWWGKWPDGSGRPHSYVDFDDLKTRSKSFSGMTTFNISYATLLEGDTPEQLSGAVVSPEFFEVIGRPALLGRTLGSGDDVPQEGGPVVIAHSLWTRRFQQDPDILHRTINLAGRQRQVVGIMPAGFEHPEPSWDEVTEYWMPLRVTDNMRTNRQFRYLRVMGRLAPGVTVEAAQAELEILGNEFRTQHGDTVPPNNPVVQSAFAELVGETQGWLVLCAAAAVLVLALAIGNIVNLLLANAAGRRRELAVRAALGAGPTRLASQLVYESTLLALGGGILGVGLASVIVKSVLSTGSDLARLDHTAIDGSVWLFALGLAVFTGIVCGVWPALRITGARLFSSLASARGTTGLEVSRARTWLIAGEMALAVPLVVGAVLLSVTLVNLIRVDAGFDPERATHFRVSIPAGEGQRYRSLDARLAFVRDVTERFGALPGVEGVGVVSSLPLGGLNNTGGTFLHERPDGSRQQLSAGFRSASAGYFDALGIPLKQGRIFTDAPEDVHTVVVNEELARTFWPDTNPIGKRLKAGTETSDSPWRTVVGVVGNVLHQELRAKAEPEVFWPYRSDAWTTLSVVIASTDPASLGPQVRPTLKAIDPLLPVVGLSTVKDIMAATRGPETFSAVSGTIFGVLALALSAFGTFAVLSLLVGHRTREIGIRFALGASKRSVRALVLRDALIPALAGCAVGTALAIWLARALSSQVFGIETQAPWVFATAVLVLLGIAMLATWWPTRRAIRVDPAITLRADV